jgi:hypothetical protein
VERQALEDFLAFDGGVQIVNIKHDDGPVLAVAVG